MAKKKFIQAMHLKKGALHKELGVPQGKKIPEGMLAKAAKAKGKLGQRARAAEMLRSLPRHHEPGVITKEASKDVISSMEVQVNPKGSHTK
jgi:TolA-binding protein